MRDILIGVLPVLGVVLGVFIQHMLARSKDRESQFANLRHETYADYLRAVSSVAKARSPENISRLTDAKSRMAIYASDEVIERLAAFEMVGADLGKAMAMEAFGKLVAQMRLESGSLGTKEGSVSTILFGAPPSPLRSSA